MIAYRCRAATAALIVGVAGLALSTPAAAQESAFKGGVSVSRLDTGLAYWDESLVASTFGGHVRLRLGFLTLQPELHLVTKGASASQPIPADWEDDQIRIEYIEVPLLAVLPLSVGDLEPFLMAGPAIMLESRCRSYIRRDGLRTNIPCDPPSGQLFQRTTFDWGAVVGGGAAYPLLGGRVFVEGRHSWGLRDIHTGPGAAEVRNRTLAFLIGYAVSWAPRDP